MLLKFRVIDTCTHPISNTSQAILPIQWLVHGRWQKQTNKQINNECSIKVLCHTSLVTALSKTLQHLQCVCKRRNCAGPAVGLNFEADNAEFHDTSGLNALYLSRFTLMMLTSSSRLASAAMQTERTR